MLFIQKTYPPQSLIKFNHELRTINSNPFYDNGSPQCLNVTTATFQELKERLEAEQRGLCCYCMQRVTANNSRVEHFLSQSMFPEYQTDYYNLYLACHGSKSQTTASEKYCDVRKGNQLITKIMAYKLSDGTKCEDLFQYVLEENEYVSKQNQYKYCWIFPQHKKYKKLEDFYRNFANLTSVQKEILIAIEVLNLNALELKESRKKLYLELKKTFDTDNRAKIENLLTDYQTKHKMNFAGAAIYFIKEKLNSL